MQIDSHQHFWVYRAEEYPWIDAATMSLLQRDYLPDNLDREQEAVGLDGSIAVQARQTLEESRWLLALAEKSPRIKGVVGWVDLCADRVQEQLREFASNPKFVGVRHVLQDEPDDLFMLRPAFLRGIGSLRAQGLTYDILIFPKHLAAAVELANRFPEQPFVLDHLAKPFIRDGIMSPWREQIRELARSPHVSCKVSGLVTEAKWGAWQEKDFWPYLDIILEAFGEDRVMFGSDWPVCLLSGTYARVVGLVRNYLETLSPESREKVLGGNALRFYGLERCANRGPGRGV